MTVFCIRKSASSPRSATLLIRTVTFLKSVLVLLYFFFVSAGSIPVHGRGQQKKQARSKQEASQVSHPNCCLEISGRRPRQAGIFSTQNMRVTFERADAASPGLRNPWPGEKAATWSSMSTVFGTKGAWTAPSVGWYATNCSPKLPGDIPGALRQSAGVRRRSSDASTRRDALSGFR
jgi:hypothetical protein